MKSLYYRYAKHVAKAHSHAPLGRSIFDSAEWDVCVILDSCRVDLLRRCFDQTVKSVWSRGSITTEWLASTFRVGAPVSNTGFVSATPHSATVFRKREWLTNAAEVDIPFPEADVVAPDDFAGFYEVWRTHASEHDAVPPETMAKATAAAANRHRRVVAHWLQPHEPFIADEARLVGGGATESNVWNGLQSGDLDSGDVWQSYKATLGRALVALEGFIQSFDGTLLITADHGNAFGEWGIYGHPFGWPQPAVRKVPWVLVECGGESDSLGGQQILDAAAGGEAASNTQKQLRALGYR
jgi:hypothetical protein